MLMRGEDHYQPGIIIDDPLGDDKITLSSPSIIANWVEKRGNGKFEVVVVFLCKDNKPWQYHPDTQIEELLKAAVQAPPPSKSGNKRKRHTRNNVDVSCMVQETHGDADAQSDYESESAGDSDDGMGIPDQEEQSDQEDEEKDDYHVDE